MAATFTSVSSSVDGDDRYDAHVLRQAAAVIRSRTVKPKGFWVEVLSRVLTDFADKIERGAC